MNDEHSLGYASAATAGLQVGMASDLKTAVEAVIALGALAVVI